MALDFLNRALGVGSNSDAQLRAMNSASMIEQGANIGDALLVNLQPTAEGRQMMANSAMKTNAEIAQNLRTRYFQKEMEQIRELQLKPMLEELQAAEKLVKSRTAVATRPVLRTVSPEEGQLITGDIANIQSMQTGMPIGPEGGIQGAPTKDGKPGAVTPTTPVPPNPALAGQFGGVQSQDQLSIMDPDTGEPVALMTDRGYAVYQQAINDFYEVNSKVQMGMMDVLAQYPTNPFAQQTMQAMMKNASQMAGQAVTGKTDPMEMQKWMDERRKMDTEIEASKAEMEVNRFNVQAGQGKQYGAAGGARARLLQDPRGVSPFFTPEDQAAVQAGGELTPQQTARAAGVYGALTAEDELGLKRDQRRAQQGLLFVPQDLVNKPEAWMQWWERSDPTFQDSLKRSYGIAVNKVMTELGQLALTEEGRAELAVKLQAAGASRLQIEMGTQPGGLAHPDLEEIVGRIAGVSGFYKGARANAMADTLALAENAQPELTPWIDSGLQQYVETRLKPLYKEKFGYDMPPSAEASIYADRHRMFAAAMADAPVTTDPQPVTGARVSNLNSLIEADQRAREADRLAGDRERVERMNTALGRLTDVEIYTPGSPLERANVRPEPESPSETARPEAGASVEQGFADNSQENAPQSEMTRVYGEGPAKAVRAVAQPFRLLNPFSALGSEEAQSPAPQAPRPRPQFEPLAPIVEPQQANPFTQLPAEVLMELLQTTPARGPARQQIAEALEIVSQKELLRAGGLE